MAINLRPDIQEVIEQITILLNEQAYPALQRLLHDSHPADIADMLEIFGDDDRLIIFNLLQDEAASEVLDETRTVTTRELIEASPVERIADLIETMPADDAAEVLSEITDEKAEDILALIEPEEAADIEQLLAFPEDTAGRLMTTKLACLRLDWSVEQASAYLREIDPSVETLTYLYVVDEARRLKGILPIRALVTARPDWRISELMSPSVISVDVMTDQEEVARLVQQYDFFALPVLEDSRLVGIITHDDVVDILQDEFTEDAQRFGGSQPLEGTYLSASPLTMVRKRVGWLLVLFVTEMLTGTVLRLFEDELAHVVALSFFIPLLIGTGGNTGSQMTATIIRALAVGEVRLSDAWRIFKKEILIGLLLGLIMAAVGFVRALTWGTSVTMALVVSSALCIIVIWANLMGLLLPLIASRLKIDPTIISGPVMSTLVDATGLLIYFLLARTFLGG